MAQSPAKKQKKKTYTKEELEELSKEELISRVLQLEAYNTQLKCSLTKRLSEVENTVSIEETKRKRAFDFSKCVKRHIMLKVLYLGWSYQGLATQEDSTKTIEHELFAVLYKTCLVESRETVNYHRCGRTDKGVSAFCQAFTLDVRSNLTEEEVHSGSTNSELPYPKILNRVLPNDIRVISWMPVPQNFSARFDCKSRTYKYFFPRGNLDLQRISEAASYLVGSHDFRNLCKMDVKNGVVNYIREILSIELKVVCEDPAKLISYDMCVLTVKGKGFLWHQIRCIVGVLFLVGQGKEEPIVVKDLLNVETHPQKPHYCLANEVPLNLFHCEFDERGEIVDKDTLISVIHELQKIWTVHAVKTTMVRTMLSCLEENIEQNINEQSSCLLDGVKRKVYQPLFERPKCESLDERIQHYVKKKKIELPESLRENMK